MSEAFMDQSRSPVKNGNKFLKLKLLKLGLIFPKLNVLLKSVTVNWCPPVSCLKTKHFKTPSLLEYVSK